MITAAPATADVGGYVGLEYTSTDFYVFGPEDVEGVDAEFSIGLTAGNWGAQFEGAISNTQFEMTELDMRTFAGHVWYGGERWRLGAMVARSDLPDFEETEWAYGVEGTFDITPKAVAWATYSEGEIKDYDTDASNFDFGLNYYVTPNLRVGAAVGNGDYDFGAIGETTTYRLNAEYQLFSAPLSLTLGWAKFDLKDDPAESESLSIGARWNFGVTTLRQRDNLTPFDYSMGYSARIDGVY